MNKKKNGNYASSALGAKIKEIAVKNTIFLQPSGIFGESITTTTNSDIVDDDEEIFSQTFTKSYGTKQSLKTSTKIRNQVKDNFITSTSKQETKIERNIRQCIENNFGFTIDEEETSLPKVASYPSPGGNVKTFGILELVQCLKSKNANKTIVPHSTQEHCSDEEAPTNTSDSTIDELNAWFGKKNKGFGIEKEASPQPASVSRSGYRLEITDPISPIPHTEDLYESTSARASSLEPGPTSGVARKNKRKNTAKIQGRARGNMSGKRKEICYEADPETHEKLMKIAEFRNKLKSYPLRVERTLTRSTADNISNLPD